ncbi:hypothetical protein [Afipia clevelandensis]|uniref:Uncharacterized protein n=1 Tax=Afipia clevelandensis ATCC 49720 TaxID=883079 RepID=K8PBF0_9BRAD|nr:hypothetical protein [Afipia clevelandensis]EKS39947.1 hypothetical protein HMPREF9696_00959 [Afipia clevelandensis ATCC 49720]
MTAHRNTRMTLLAGTVWGAALLAFGSSGWAQSTTVERSAQGPAAKDIRIGVYLNVQPDCTSGTLPAIRLVNPPSNGTVNVKRGKVTATNYKQCMALEVPGFVAFYRSKADFSGTDVVTLEVKYPQGRTEIQRITVKVGGAAGPGGRNI